MKVIIAGSRTITDMLIVEEAIKASKFDITEVVCGMAKGVDRLGRAWAVKAKGVLYKEFPANWSLHGKGAGIMRNVNMATYADALIAVWDGKSRGTEHMIKVAKARKLKVYVHYTNKTNKRTDEL